MNSYDETDRPHHKECPAYEGEGECQCEQLEEDAYDRAMDQKYDEWKDRE